MNEYDKYSLEELEYMHKEISEIDKEITHLEGKFKETANKFVNATKKVLTNTKSAINTITHNTMKTNYLQKLKGAIERTVRENKSKKVRVQLHTDTLEIEFFKTEHFEIPHKKIIIKQTGKRDFLEIYISHSGTKPETKTETFENAKTMIARLVLQNV